jgi:hypothetical protein
MKTAVGPFSIKPVLTYYNHEIICQNESHQLLIKAVHLTDINIRRIPLSGNEYLIIATYDNESTSDIVISRKSL